MTEPKKYWLIDLDGVACLAGGVPARDALLEQGWAEIDEPCAVTQVHVQHEDSGARSTLPAGALELWATRGWYPVEPPAPEPYAPGATVPEVPVAPAIPEPAPAPSEPSKPKPAAGGKTEEK